jgi:hypothetical protein
MSGSVFDRPPALWSDDEVRVGLAEVARAMEFYSAAGEPAAVDVLHGIACVLADERDSRRALARAVDDACLL